ncbi:S1C family serine protease [Patescibacteria group bacterium]|nr:S1C family serine protease [Patescibacteria group bacterium]
MDLKIPKIFKPSSDAMIVRIVIIATIFGFSAGVVGQMVSHVYIDPYLEPYTYAYNINTNVADIPELRRIRSFSGTQQDIVVENLSQKIGLSLAGLYLKKSQTSDIAKNIYLEDDLLANCFVLTSDGWLTCQSSTIKNYGSKQLTVLLDKTTHDIDEIVSDTLTNVSFIKINAHNLTPVVLGDWKESTIGQTVVVMNSVGQSTITNIENLNFKDDGKTAIRSTEIFYKYILLKDELANAYLGSAVVNLGGEVIGVLEKTKIGELQKVIPTNYFFSVILGVLRQGEIQRPGLGLKYIDLSDTNTTQQKNGALIYQDPSRTSPAYQAELKIDDIIISVDGVPVDNKNTLTQLIQEYRIGDDIELVVIREEQERVVEAFLGEAK